MYSKGVLSIALLMMILISERAFAEIWELGYTKPVVEEIVDSDSDVQDESAIETIAEAPVESEKAPEEPVKVDEKKSTRSLTRISTAKNTYGVETVEQQKSSIYLSPVFGFSSVFGSATVNITPQYTFGARAGYLLLDNLMIEAGYTRGWMTTSAPVSVSIGYQPQDVFDYKLRTVDLGAKLFFLGRESRLRPFVFGGFAYTNATLNYAPNYQLLTGGMGDFEISQFQGSGQLGLEFAFSRRVVATAMFQLNGILSHKASAPANKGGAISGLESSRIDAGNSLSHSANYSGSVGLGVYF